ncbi:hypothetical protein A3F55_01915 [Candidatus Adlerbacteria bacterium RIFCSPHIGHO2_12_FULL_53_18]|uniref:Uncharacterized protein n=1 Tax=Candidatus Adlerbacteria bacterium RIFCSPHIGHO2_12_FULL_53_18 TaxID=1797242 RepID=A0A1F4XTY0_9BACT|nr:MAG: hypothetical protein A3F55_01915 [Candidatus Adlerbacteria bacterium RIFCSPHIGHO2_12_FULL_53_18]
MADKWKSEREVWDFFHSEEGKGAAESNQHFFRKLFPAGHRQSIRPDIALVGKMTNKERWGYIAEHKPFLNWFREIHPHAFAFLVRYGKNYAPIIMGAPPSWGEPGWATCYYNSLLLMTAVNKKRRRRPLVYVEGIVMGALAHPMLHAWNAYSLEGRQALDWTHYFGSRWSRYLGIPFTEGEYERLRKDIAPKKKDLVLSLYSKKNFPKVEEMLLNILETRE